MSDTHCLCPMLANVERKHSNREKKWAKLINKMEKEDASSWRSNKNVKKMAKKGIPPSVRAHVWLHLSGAITLKEKHAHVYDALCTQRNDIDEQTLRHIRID